IITSDHGDQFGEHGIPHHANSLYMQLLHVPFIVLCPERIPAGVRVPEPVSLANLPAAIVDILDAPLTTHHLPSHQTIPGMPLARFWRSAGSRPKPEPVYSDLDIIIPQWQRVLQMRSVVAEGYHYIVNRYDGRQELYHWAADLHE